MFKATQLWSTFSLLLLVSACGFHMRGQSPSLAAGQQLWLESRVGDKQVLRLLKRQLLQRQIVLLSGDKQNGVGQKADADNIIVLVSQASSQTASAYDTQGDVIEYTLLYQLQFTVNDNVHRFSTRSTYRYDKAQLLSSEQNNTLAQQENVEQAVAFILRQLSAL